MALNLVDSVKGLFTGDVVSNAASSLGESENNIQKALSGAIPASLVGMLNKAGSGTNGASGLLDLAKQASGSGILGSIKGLLGGGGIGNIASMASGLFGDKLGSIIRTISSFAGIKESSASAVMNMAAPVALATVGKEATSSNMGAGGLLSMLNSQKDSILGSIPSGLNVAGALGLGSLGDISNKLSGAIGGIGSGTRSAANYAGETAKKGTNWLLPLLILAIVGVGAWYFLGRNKTKSETEITPTETTATNPVSTETVATPTTESFKVKLPDGSELDAFKGGTEDKLVAFLNTNWKSLGDDSLKKIWFDFDNLNFETGRATLTAESQKQVSNIAAIMKAFGDAKIKIGGYTDKIGDAAANKKLSQQRADAVAAAIKAKGADATRITGAEGYGEEFATVDEKASDEQRRKDRRTAISVRQ